MNAVDVIKQIQENASEYLEMVDDPAMFIAGIMANKIVELKNHIEYLEGRLKHVGSNANSTDRAGDYAMARPEKN